MSAQTGRTQGEDGTEEDEEAEDEEKQHKENGEEEDDTANAVFLSGRSERCIEEGDTVMIYVSYGNCCPIEVRRGQTLTMRYGALRHEYLIGRPFGSRVSASAGYVHALRPTAELWSRSLAHRTQIVYSADAALVTLLLELKPGVRLAEAGTGSAAAAHSFARALAPTGRLFTYERDAERLEQARQELAGHGLGALVELRRADVCRDGLVGCAAGSLDAVFLDLPRPWESVRHAAAALRPFGRFCAFSPCLEQCQRSCAELRRRGFAMLATVELVPKTYKLIDANANANAAGTKRKRPNIGGLHCVPFPVEQPSHTGYLTSATFFG